MPRARALPRPPTRGRRIALVLAACAVLPAAGCSDDPLPPPLIRTLDGPTDIAFTCYGRMRVTGGLEPTDDQIVLDATPMSVAACQGWDGFSINEEEVLVTAPPAGQGPAIAAGEVVSESVREELFAWRDEVRLYGFVLQKSLGTMAVFRKELGEDAPGGVVLLDADPFNPGLNVIPVGSQPVGITTDTTGCYLTTANSGSCDLSRVEVASVLDPDRAAEVRRLAVTNAAGDPVVARPRAMTAPASTAAPGFECGDAPTGLIYVAYPECNAVAVVDAATGVIQASVVFDETGAVLADGNLTCAAASCGLAPTPPTVDRPDAGPPDAGIPDAGAGVAATEIELAAAFGGPGRPVALHMSEDGRRLYIGADNSALITVVELGDDALPTEVWDVALEGEVGITDLYASELIPMGGDDGDITDGNFGDFRFVYGVATDGTVRVAEVESRRRECETQVDPRYLHDVTDGALLSCLPVGDPAYPRRVGARSPGIDPPGDARPISITMAAVANPGDDQPTVSPFNMVGHFAYITLSDGAVLVVNIDDDNYPDYEDPDDPLAVDLVLALPHQIRDRGSERSVSIFDEAPADGGSDAGVGPDAGLGEANECIVYSDSVTVHGPRMTSGSATDEAYLTTFYSADNPALTPSLRRVACVEADGDQQAVPDLAYVAPDDVREQAFPDLARAANETWDLTWEGRLSRDSSSSDVDGPPIRTGAVQVDGNGMVLRDGSAPFCGMGAEPGDLVTLIGCDPALGDALCRIGEECVSFVDPTDGTTTLGLCLPANRADSLAATCEGFIRSRRRYRVGETFADRLTLSERYRVLRTTPPEGCADSAQCDLLYGVEQALVDDATPPARGFECAPEPGRDPARNVCLMTCDANSPCEDGWECNAAGYCVEGTLPPAECVATLQRYDVRVGDAYAVIGGATGFLHRRMVDPDSGACVDDPNAHPLIVGRLPLVAPPCTGDGLTDLSPNPCSVTVDHTEKINEREVASRQATAIRLRTPAFTMHLVDPLIDPSAAGFDCPGCPLVPTVSPGDQLGFGIVGGFFDRAIRAFDGQIVLFYPARALRGPLGNLWFVDQGDTTSTIRGQVVQVTPGIPDTLLTLIR
ncbi:hypothetical protein [Haliangium sp.]|uniref:hypothetical protein n=1 Tax=Haliangium sp. TaxID=2663208 RepID=UPI003D10D14F